MQDFVEKFWKPLIFNLANNKVGKFLAETWFWFRFEVYYPIKFAPGRFMGRIRALKFWIPFIWENWYGGEWTTIIEFIKHKLEFERRYFKKEKYIAEKTARKIRGELIQAMKLLGKVDQFIYTESLWKEHHKKYGHLSFGKEKQEDGYISTKLSYSKVKTPQQEKDADKDAHKIMAEEEKLKQKKKKEAFDYIADHIEDWWD